VTDGSIAAVNSKFKAAVEARKAAQRAADEARKRAAADEEDLIPEAVYSETEEDSELDRFINGLDVVEAYNKWSGKPKARPRPGQTESIKVSCPDPSHPDKNPSAWLNRKKNLWTCGGCEKGGDVYDIAAFHFGLPNYKSGGDFHKLRRLMAEDYGYSFATIPGVKEPIAYIPEKKTVVVDTDSDDVPEENIATVSDIMDDDSFYEEDELIFPTLDWRDITPPQTFMDAYMAATTRDDVAEEYHFFNGLLALGFAIGRDVTLFDSMPVYSNLFVCLVGHTGDGKSRSFRHLQTLLKICFPYKPEEDYPKGVKIIKGTASAESLIMNFDKPVMDPVNPKRIADRAGVRGLIEFNELSSLTGRASRMGSVLKPTLLEFYDADDEIGSSAVTSGEKKAVDAFGSAFTTTQPDSIKDLADKNDGTNGFLNRWIFASGKEKLRIPIGGAIIDIRSSIPYLQAVRSWCGRTHKTIEWDEDAAERFTDFYHKVIHPTMKKDKTGMMARSDLLMKKLILLFCANEMADTATLDIVNRVIKMYPYLISSFGIPAEKISRPSSPRGDLKEDICKYAERFTKRKGAITIRDINRAIGKKYDPPEITKMISGLVDVGVLEIEEPPRKRVGRPTVKYVYVA